jgi:hypothetical protein
MTTLPSDQLDVNTALAVSTRRRLAGRVKQEVRRIARSARGTIQTPEPFCVTYAETAAITSAKVTPAYAHSFNRRSPGSRMTMAAAGLATPRTMRADRAARQVRSAVGKGLQFA